VLKFTTAKLGNGSLELGGPATPNPGMEVRHLRFVIAQDGTLVEDEADDVSGGQWTWTGSAGGLQPGTAHGFGIAVMFKQAAPPSFETFSWLEEVTLGT
jgi:hypothetical protein